MFSNLYIQQFISFLSQNWNHYSSEKSSLKRSFPEKLHNFRNSQITVTIVALVATVVTVQLRLIKYLVNHISKQSCLDLDNFTKLSNSHYNNFCLSRRLCIYYPPTATVKYLFNINKKNNRFILYFFLVYLSQPLIMHSEKLIHFPEKGCSVTNTEAVTRRCSIKQVILEILQNLLENTCARVSFLIKLQASTCVF